MTGRRYPAVALLLLVPAAAKATCAIAVWTPDRIIIAADSKETILNPDRGPVSFNECKIRRIGAYYAAVSGVTEHRRTGFDVWRILEESVRGAGSVPDAAEAAAAAIARRYAEVLEAARESGDAKYVHGLESNAPEFAIGGFSGGRPYLAQYQYDLVRGRWVWHKDVFGRSAGDSMGLAYLCDPRGIERYKRRHPRWRSDDPLKTVTGMVAETAGIDPSEVGGATAVMVLDQSGVRWVNAGMCR
jgi:hypothetical protein